VLLLPPGDRSDETTISDRHSHIHCYHIKKLCLLHEKVASAYTNKDERNIR
jgi:hypothetical protein